MAGAVAGREEDVDLEPGELEPLAAGDGLVGVVALVRPEAGPGDEGHDVGEHRDLDLGAVDRRARSPRATGATAPMWSKWVWVSRIASMPIPSSLDRAEDALGLVAGIDDQPAVGALAAEDEAVLGHRADGEAADVHLSALRCCLRAWASRRAWARRRR